MSEQIQTRAERELETWKIWAANVKMLRDIHEEIDEKIENKNNLIYSDEPHKLMKGKDD